MTEPVKASLYAHVPFCAGACDYCDFYSIPVNSDDKRLQAYTEKLLTDSKIMLEKFKVNEIPSLYIGGGTPSILGIKLIPSLVRGLCENHKSISEITIEVNPESIGRDLLLAMKESGVTRISAGIQTFHEPSRTAVNRAGDSRLLFQRLGEIAEIFPGKFSADLISGLPFQSENVMRNDIEKLLSFKPAHISLYALTVDPQTPLGIRQAKSQANLPDKDEADRLWLYGRNALEKAGYAQYEVSNFCVPGKESVHNLRYWRMENWLGIGPAASGTLINDEAGTGFRYTIPSDADAWLESAQQIFYEELDTVTLMKETFLMGFRTVFGPDEILFRRRFKKSIEETIPESIGKWRGRGLLHQEKNALTKQGLLLLDAFLIDVFSEMENLNM